jgi:hypothetical protein
MNKWAEAKEFRFELHFNKAKLFFNFLANEKPSCHTGTFAFFK